MALGVVMTEQQTALLVVVVTVLFQSGVLTALAVGVRRWVEAQLGPERARVAWEVAGQVVQAVEQLDRRYHWSSREKLDQALRRARDLGETHGVQLSDEQWRSLIEGAVGALTQVQEALATAGPAASGVPPRLTTATGPGTFTPLGAGGGSVAPPPRPPTGSN